MAPQKKQATRMHGRCPWKVLCKPCKSPKEYICAEDTLYGDPANVWEEIQQKFPYYKTMEEYHGSNPAVDLSAVANSQSDVLTDVLQHHEAGEHQDDEDGAKEDTGDSGRAPVTPKSKLT
ncbi:hypothetical protein PM082_024953 [Marasmius tenuissimus]|nr:hypothetical protein PM082_024953 [Marasmius tenuissimus]